MSAVAINLVARTIWPIDPDRAGSVDDDSVNGIISFRTPVGRRFAVSCAHQIPVLGRGGRAGAMFVSCAHSGA